MPARIWREWRCDGGDGPSVFGDEIGVGARPVTGTLGLDDDGVVQQAIQQGGDDDRQTIILRIVVIAVCSSIAAVERLTGLTGWVKSIYRIVCDMYPGLLLIMHSEHSRSSSSWVGQQAPRPIPPACLAPGTRPGSSRNATRSTKRWVMRIGNASRKLPANPHRALDLRPQHHAAMRGQSARVDRDGDFLAEERWKRKSRRSIVTPGGSGL